MDQSEAGLIKGVFTIEKTMRIGSGATARRVKQKSYFYAEQVDADLIILQPLTENNMPSGVKNEVTKEELLNDYMPDPELYHNEVLPKMREVNKTVAKAERFRKMGNTFSAEHEFSKALDLDEANIRANFGIGLCYIQRGENEKAHQVFERLVKIDAAFELEHKHLFNEFGINLRKSGMYVDAIDYYKRAIELVGTDENLHYNIARAYFEDKDYPNASAHVKKALELDPKHQEALKMLNYLKKKDLD